MNFLEKAISKHASVSENGIINVDSFLNHQIDTNLMDEIGKKFSEMFDATRIDRIITIEPSGIAPALMASRYMNGVPVVYAKRRKSANTMDAVHTAIVRNSRGEETARVIIEKKFIPKYERVLIIDDIIAGGNSIAALIEIVEAAGAEVKGILCAIEKDASGGAERLRKSGYDVSSIARIKTADFETQKIEFK